MRLRSGDMATTRVKSPSGKWEGTELQCTSKKSVQEKAWNQTPLQHHLQSACSRGLSLNGVPAHGYRWRHVGSGSLRTSAPSELHSV